MTLPVYAIIPARGGSKRIPRKNIKSFLGNPMLGHVLEMLRDSDLFDQIVVSTDDAEIKKVAEEYRADRVLVRPLNLADDLTPTQPVIQHSIEQLKLRDAMVCCVYPCNPLLTTTTLETCLKLSQKRPDRFCFPILEYPHPIQRAFSLEDNFDLSLVNPEAELSRTQDLPTRYHDSGSFYFGKSELWMSNARIHSNAIGVPISKTAAIDIDNEDDWVLAEQLCMAIQRRP